MDLGSARKAPAIGGIKRTASAMASPPPSTNAFVSNKNGFVDVTPLRQSTSLATPLAPGKRGSPGIIPGSGMRSNTDDDMEGTDTFTNWMDKEMRTPLPLSNQKKPHADEDIEDDDDEVEDTMLYKQKRMKKTKMPLLASYARTMQRNFVFSKVDLFKVVAHLQLRQLRLAMEKGDCMRYFIEGLHRTAQTVAGGSMLNFLSHLARESLSLASVELARDSCDRDTMYYFSVALGHLEGLSRLELDLQTVRRQALTRIQCVYLPYLSGLLEFMRSKARNGTCTSVLQQYATQIEDNFRAPL